jgi:hypothetical protein
MAMATQAPIGADPGAMLTIGNMRAAPGTGYAD